MVPSCHRASPQPWSPLAMEHPGCSLGQGAGQGAGTRSSWHSRAVGHSQGWPQGTPGAGRLPRYRERREVSRVCHAPAPNWPSRPGQPRGNPEGARGLPVGATARHREQGRQRDAPRLGTASEQALCSRGWKQVAVMSCCQNVSPSWDSEGCHLGTSPAPCSPHHSRALSCLMLPQDGVWGVHWEGKQDPAPHPLRCCAHGGPQLSSPLLYRVTIPLYDADTGLLVLAGKVRCRGWGV